VVDGGNCCGVIFDMDGVLVESYRPHFESWRITAREYGKDMTEAQFARGFGRTSREIIRDLWGEVPEAKILEFDRRKEAVYRELIREKIPAVPGVFELVSALATDGFKLAVGSSGPIENVDLVLDGLGLRKYFSAVVSARDVTKGKPDPEVFLTAAKKLGLAPNRCVVIEDAVPGIQAAHNAGMKVIALTTSHPKDKLVEADLIAADLRGMTANQIRSLL